MYHPVFNIATFYFLPRYMMLVIFALLLY